MYSPLRAQALALLALAYVWLLTANAETRAISDAILSAVVTGNGPLASRSASVSPFEKLEHEEVHIGDLTDVVKRRTLIATVLDRATAIFRPDRDQRTPSRQRKRLGLGEFKAWLAAAGVAPDLPRRRCKDLVAYRHVADDMC